MGLDWRIRTTRWVAVVVVGGSMVTLPICGQTAAKAPVDGPAKDDLLRGGYGPYRANHDLLFYHLTLRVDPEKKTIAGANVGAVSDAGGWAEDPVGADSGVDAGEHQV